MMHIISFRILRKYAENHSDCQEALSTWYKIATKAKWSNLVEVQQVFPKAEAVSNFTVFNIKGGSLILNFEF
ncbi:type II toxin-antitoxin system HigB family toxin [Nostoc sp.]|uniref:type II toxin-antitoxin system HigB family toxin n=1 Tax=Nostoc sp. TaxID=1180 RepID=UPI002FFB0DC6